MKLDRKKFAKLDDSDLSALYRDTQAEFTRHRKGFGKTKQRADEKIEDARRGAAQQVERGIASVRFAAGSGQGGITVDPNLAAFWTFAHADELWKEIHAAVDADPLPGEAELFIAQGEAEWQVERDRLETAIREIEAEIAMREADEVKKDADRRVADIVGRASA